MHSKQHRASKEKFYSWGSSVTQVGQAEPSERRYGEECKRKHGGRHAIRMYAYSGWSYSFELKTER